MWRHKQMNKYTHRDEYTGFKSKLSHCSFCLRFSFSSVPSFLSVFAWIFFAFHFIYTVHYARIYSRITSTAKILSNNQICDDSCNDCVHVNIWKKKKNEENNWKKCCAEPKNAISKRLKYCGWFNDNYWTCALRKHIYIWIHLNIHCLRYYYGDDDDDVDCYCYCCCVVIDEHFALKHSDGYIPNISVIINNCAYWFVI